MHFFILIEDKHCLLDLSMCVINASLPACASVGLRRHVTRSVTKSTTVSSPAHVLADNTKAMADEDRAAKAARAKALVSARNFKYPRLSTV